MKKIIIQKRLLNIARRMLYDGEYFYTQDSPRMSIAEYHKLEELGFRIQSEWPHPPETRMFYMMLEFENRNLELYNKLLIKL